MGDPSKPRKKYRPPRNPWRSDQLSQELFLVGTYGLRNKRELWRAQSELSKIRKQIRALLAKPATVRAAEVPRLLSYLSRMGLIDSKATLDDVLGLTIENILERRLQTLVWRKGLAKTPHQARQFVTHGHVSIGQRIIRIPSYVTSKVEEDSVRITEGSTVTQQVQA